MRLPFSIRRLLCTLAAGCVLPADAQVQQVAEHDLKAAFIYHFVQFTQWPKEPPPGPHLVICASRGTALFMALKAIAGKTANDRRIVLRPLAEATAGECQVVVATEADRSRLLLIRRVSENTPVLTVTDDPELVQEGMMIGMVVDAGKMAFVVDNTRAIHAGLGISSRLLRLAKSIQ